MTRGLAIGDLAKRAGVTLQTIRYYERIGLMPQPDRTAGGHRHYSQGQMQRLSFICRARAMGFNIAEVRALLDLSEPGQRSCVEVRDIAAKHLASIHAKLTDLARLEHILSDAVTRCSGDRVPACAVLDMLDSDVRLEADLTAPGRGA